MTHTYTWPDSRTLVTWIIIRVTWPIRNWDMTHHYNVPWLIHRQCGPWRVNAGKWVMSLCRMSEECAMSHIRIRPFTRDLWMKYVRRYGLHRLWMSHGASFIIGAWLIRDSILRCDTTHLQVVWSTTRDMSHSYVTRESPHWYVGHDPFVTHLCGVTWFIHLQCGSWRLTCLIHTRNVTHSRGGHDVFVTHSCGVSRNIHRQCDPWRREQYYGFSTPLRRCTPQCSCELARNCAGALCLVELHLCTCVTCWTRSRA